MNWLNISCDERVCMIYLCFLRCLRDLKKWSWLGKIGKNGQKWAKMAAPESPIVHYFCKCFEFGAV